MLKQLRVTNIILVESAHIDFAEGFNVLSGETGSGKSAIMSALSLITGGRADTSLIRKGADKGIVEAVFDLKEMSFVEYLLEKGGIDFEKGEELFLRREISVTGKSRAFINNQLAQLSLIRAICNHLINMIGQYANQDLLLLERHREILDLFGGFQEEVSAFSIDWEEELSLQNELDTLVHSEAQRLRETEVCEMIQQELSEANIKEEEEEGLFNEYNLLIHTEELSTKVQDICQSLNGEKMALLPQLLRQKSTLDSLVRIDASLAEVFHSFQTAILELQEAVNILNRYQSQLEPHPERLVEVNERLTLLARLKKKYGSTLQEIQLFSENNKKKLFELQNTDHKIDDLKKQLDLARNRNHQIALKLTADRKAAAQKLSIALKNELASLNMPKVDFYIDVSPQKRGRKGDDHVEFFLLPNVGEHRIPIKDCASGGELSRVMLALQTVLCGKERISTLVFDEIDGNIGGETAKIVGSKLRDLGKKQQVLCITHFPQVARFADHHLQISKRVVGDRTLTFVNLLEEDMREYELARMSGN